MQPEEFMPSVSITRRKSDEPGRVKLPSCQAVVRQHAVDEGEVMVLSDTQPHQDEKMDQGYGNLALEIALDRQRITKLEQVKPQPFRKDRGDILRALIAANGGKMLATDARKKMHLSPSRFSELLAVVKDEIEVKPYHLRKNLKVLILK